MIYLAPHFPKKTLTLLILSTQCTKMSPVHFCLHPSLLSIFCITIILHLSITVLVGIGKSYCSLYSMNPTF